MMTTWEYEEKYGEIEEVDQVKCWNLQGCPVHDRKDPIESAFVGVEDFKFRAGLTVTVSDLEQWKIRSEECLRAYGKEKGRVLMLGDAC